MKMNVRTVLSTVLLVFVAALIVGGFVVDQLPITILFEGSGIALAGVVLYTTIFGAAALKTGFLAKIYEWNLDNGYRLGWTLVAVGSLLFIWRIPSLPSFAAAEDMLVVFLGLYTLFVTSLFRKQHTKTL